MCCVAMVAVDGGIPRKPCRTNIDRLHFWPHLRPALSASRHFRRWQRQSLPPISARLRRSARHRFRSRHWRQLLARKVASILGFCMTTAQGPASGPIHWLMLKSMPDSSWAEVTPSISVLCKSTRRTFRPLVYRRPTRLTHASRWLAARRYYKPPTVAATPARSNKWLCCSHCRDTIPERHSKEL